MSTFRYWRDPLCLAACTAYLVNQLFLKQALAWPLLHFWFNDFWLIPAALPPVLWLQRRFRLRIHDSAPEPAEIIGHLLVWSVVCEGIGPLLVPAREGDWRDVVAYALGALVAGLWWNRTAFLTQSHPSRARI